MFFNLNRFNPFQQNNMNQRIEELENKVYELEKSIESDKRTMFSKLLRIKNGDQLPNSFIISQMGYQDLSPTKAFKLYNQHDKNFVVLDVSAKGFNTDHQLHEAIKIQVEDLEYQIQFEVPSQTTPIFVISEDGVQSVLACQILFEMGYLNINNISGGYKFWPEKPVIHHNVKKSVA